MSLPKRRRARKEFDRQYEDAAGVKHSDPEADRIAGGNVYSSADIAALEREHLAYWRRKKRKKRSL